MSAQTYQKVFWIKELSFDENVVLSILNSKLNFKKLNGKYGAAYLDVKAISKMLGKSADSIYHVINLLRDKKYIRSVTAVSVKGVTYKKHSIINTNIFKGKKFNNIPLNASVSVSLPVLSMLSEISTKSYLTHHSESILFTAKDAEERFGIKKRTYHRYINTLIQEGYIYKIDTYTYSLTEKSKMLFNFSIEVTENQTDVAENQTGVTENQTNNNHPSNLSDISLIKKISTLLKEKEKLSSSFDKAYLACNDKKEKDIILVMKKTAIDLLYLRQDKIMVGKNIFDKSYILDVISSRTEACLLKRAKQVSKFGRSINYKNCFNYFVSVMFNESFIERKKEKTTSSFDSFVKGNYDFDDIATWICCN